MRGVDRSREVYCRWSCDLRYSGGLWEGGCVGGNRVIGGGDLVIWCIDGAGAIAETVERYLYEGEELGRLLRR